MTCSTARAWDYGPCVKVREAGFEKDLAYYRDRLAVIVPNIRRLQDAFRSAGMEVIHTRIQSMTADGGDRGLSHKKLGHAAPPGSKEAEILDELKPVGDGAKIGGLRTHLTRL